MINIGLVNELAVMCDRMGIYVWEIIDAAATKPFGFMPFYPDPGRGGHCTPIDPFYLLSWKTRQAGIETRFIELAGYIKSQILDFIVQKIQNALNDVAKAVPRIHLVGVAYKRDIDDVRESPALEIMHLLMSRGAVVTYSDPYVGMLEIDGKKLHAQPIENSARNADCSVVVTDHCRFDYAALIENARLVVDTPNALKTFSSSNIVRV